jgi:hypothetical protein
MIVQTTSHSYRTSLQQSEAEAEAEAQAEAEAEAHSRQPSTNTAKTTCHGTNIHLWHGSINEQ